MSNYRAVATVTLVLKNLLSEVLKKANSQADVTTLSPDSPDGKLPNPGANLFLYQVSPNAAYRNNTLPTRRADGQMVQRPRTALDLNYLISFYGDGAKFEPQLMLGLVVRTLEERPFLSQERISQVIKSLPASDLLSKSNLADEAEPVRLTPLSLSLEEMSKIWAFFSQTSYSLSVAYQACLVQIESEQTPEPGLPVRQRNLYVVTFRQPQIDRIDTYPTPDQPITSTSTLALYGQQFRSDIVQVQIDDQVPVAISAEDLRDDRIIFALPPGQRAGVRGLQVVQPRLMGTPPVPHTGVTSNVAAFILRPVIPANPVFLPPPPNQDPKVRVTFQPPVARDQRVILLLNQVPPSPGASGKRYSFPAPSWNSFAPAVTELASMDFVVKGAAAGTYFVRAQVDGAESLLTSDASGAFTGPKVVIP